MTFKAIYGPLDLYRKGKIRNKLKINHGLSNSRTDGSPIISHARFLLSISSDASRFQVSLNIHEPHAFLFLHFSHLFFARGLHSNIFLSAKKIRAQNLPHTLVKQAYLCITRSLLFIYTSRLFW